MPGRPKKAKTSETSKPSSSKQPSPTFDCLPDECLLLIFQHLNLRNRIVMERVCKRWREISLKSWSNVEVLSLGYSDEFDDIYPMSFDGFSSVLRRGKDSIIALSFDDYVKNFPPDIFFEILNEYCNKVQHLEMQRCFRYQTVNINKLSARIAKNLKSVIIDEYDIKNVHYFLKKAVNLEVVSFSSGCRFTISSLRNLSDKCVSLEIDGCEIQNKQHAIQLFQKLSNLLKLNASCTKIFPEALVPVSQNLVTLILNGNTFNFFKGGGYKKLVMPNLKYLSLKQNENITDEVLSSFYKCFPSLMELYLEGCGNIKFTPACNLGKCENIKLMDLSETETKDEGLIYLATNVHSLESLQCRYTDITEIGYTKAVTCLPKLNELFVGDISTFTEKIFEAALKSAESRTQEDKPLKISLDYSSDVTDEVLSKCKLKKLEKDDPPQSKYLIISSGWQKFDVDNKKE